jgi:hypothetical protein
MRTISKMMLFVAAAVSIVFASCEQEVPTPVETKVFKRTITLKDESGENEAQLTFKAHSQKLLDGIKPDELKLVAIYENPESTNIDSSEPSLADPTATGESEIKAENILAIEVETIRQDAKAVALALDWKREKNGVESRDLYPPGLHIAFYTTGAARRYQVNNYTYNPLKVSFYYENCGDGYCTSAGILGVISKYSGHSYTLYNDGWAYYYNCGKQVGVLVDGGYIYYNYRWTWWSNCRP